MICGVSKMMEGAKELSSSSESPQDRQAAIRKSLSSMKEYKEPGGSFSISYPDSWELEPLTTGLIFHARLYHGNVNIRVSKEDVPATTTTEQYKDAIIDTIKKTYPQLNLKILSTDKIDLHGTPALKSIQTTTPPTKDVAKQMDVVSVKKAKGYTITITTSEEWFPQFEPVFNKMVESVTL